MRSISSLLPIEKAATSPSAALDISLTIPWTRVLLLPAVAAVHPIAKFLSAMSNLLLGDESTAFGVLTAPCLILVISSHGAASTIASIKD